MAKRDPDFAVGRDFGVDLETELDGQGEEGSGWGDKGARVCRLSLGDEMCDGENRRDRKSRKTTNLWLGWRFFLKKPSWHLRPRHCS